MKPKYLKRFKSGFKADIGISVRSESEYIYALWLNERKKDGTIVSWEYEPKEFLFPEITRGCVGYIPDFKVWISPYEYEWHEVKGWLDQKSRTKIKRFKKYYPEEFEKMKLIEEDFIKYLKGRNNV